MERSDRRLELSTEEMRRLGYRVVDMLIAHVESLAGETVATSATRASLAGQLDAAMPRDPSSIDDVLERVADIVLRNIAHVDHPRFFAYVPSPGNFVGAMADALAAGFNVFAGAWPVASGPAHLELLTIDWLRGLCGMPAEAGGLFVSGGSAANLTALVVARNGLDDTERERSVIYYSEHAHSSIERALDVIGVPASRRRVVCAGNGFALGATAIEAQIETDRAAGLRPWCVVVNGGATSTGVVDELAAVAALCRREGVWMHVDAAYGGGALMSDEGRRALAGIGDAESVALDPHKWLFQPFDIGCVLVRDESALERTFRHVPAYLRDSAHGGDEVNFRDRGIELTRPFRALKLWMSFALFGADAIGAAVERGLELARIAERRLRASGRWRIVTAAQLGIVTFRYRFEQLDEVLADDAHRRLAALLFDDGFALASTTELAGRVCLRLCTINPRTSDEDVIATIERIEALAAQQLAVNR
jgi:glutamate/tyrosine decarboxylase-like PLP-dependent enzyme